MEIERIIANKFLASHPMDATQLLEKHPLEEVGSLLESISSRLGASVIQRFNLLTATQCLMHMTPEKVGAILEHLSVPDAVLLLRRLEISHRTSILDHLRDETRSSIQDVLDYPEGTVGALMDSGVPTVFDNMTVAEGIKEVKAYANRLIEYLYVLNREKQLMGVLNLPELFMASSPTASISSIMQTNVQKLAAYSDLRKAEIHPGWQAYSTLPVVEERARFVGALRYKTLHKLDREGKGKKLAGQLEVAGMALGELYKIGLSGLVRSAISITDSEDKV